MPQTLDKSWILTELMLSTYERFKSQLHARPEHDSTSNNAQGKNMYAGQTRYEHSQSN